MKSLSSKFVYGLKWQGLQAKNKFATISELSSIKKTGTSAAAIIRSTVSGYQVGLTSKINIGKFSAAAAIANNPVYKNTIFLLRLSENEYYFLVISDGRIAESSDEVKDKLGIVESLETELDIHTELKHTVVVDQSFEDSKSFIQLTDGLTAVKYVDSLEVLNGLEKYQKNSKISGLKSFNPKLIAIAVVVLAGIIYFLTEESPDELRRKQYLEQSKTPNLQTIEKQKKRRKEKLFEEAIFERTAIEKMWLSNIIVKPSGSRIVEKLASTIRGLPSNIKGWEIVQMKYLTTPQLLYSQAAYPPTMEVEWRRLSTGSVNSLKEALGSQHSLAFSNNGDSCKQFINIGVTNVKNSADPLGDLKKFGQTEMHNIKSMLQLSTLTWDITKKQEAPIPNIFLLPEELQDEKFELKTLIPHFVHISKLQGKGIFSMERAYRNMNRYQNFVVTEVQISLTGSNAFSWVLNGYLLGELGNIYIP